MATAFLGLPTVTAGTLIKASDWNSMVNKIDAAIKKIMVVEKLVDTVILGTDSGTENCTSNYDFVQVSFEHKRNNNSNTARDMPILERKFKCIRKSTSEWFISTGSFEGDSTSSVKVTLAFTNNTVRSTSTSTEACPIIIEFYKYQTVSV